MKRILMMAVTVCLSIMSANALIVSVEDHGEISAEGMEITMDQAETDPLTGVSTMGLKGSLLSQAPVTVTIRRSASGLTDEFCCANQCTSGNKATEETLSFTPNGDADWYTHYTPAAGSKETIIYTFSDGSESYALTVHYNYATQGIEDVQEDKAPCTKVIKEGILYIIKGNKTYTIL